MNRNIRIIVIMTTLIFSGNFTGKIVAQTSFKSMIGLSCGFIGQPSEVMKSFEELIKDNDVELIVELIDTGNLAQQCIAVMTCEMLEEKRAINLTKAIKDKILILYDSNQKIMTCTGCMLGSTMNVSQLLGIKSPHSFGGAIRNWLRKIYEDKKS